MTSPKFLHSPWRKSSRSSGGEGQCVEVAAPSRERTLIRDSKNPSGPVLAFTPAEWAAFLDDAKTGAFDLGARARIAR